MAQIKLAEYTFDNSVGDVLPYLTPNTINMTKEDSVSGTTTRRIVYIDNATMPTNINFFRLDGLTTLDYLNITSSVTDMKDMLYQCTRLTYVNAENWDTRNVTTMSGVFYECKKLQTIEGLENWNVGKNKSFYMTFYRCESLQEANITNWKAPLCTNIQEMFRQCYTLKNLDLSGFEVSTTSGVNMLRCFQHCENLKITGLNTMKVKPNNLNFTFANLESTEVHNNFDLSTWDTSLCTNFGCMFEYSYSIRSIDVSNWVFKTDTTAINSIFNECHNLTKIIGLDTWILPVGATSLVNLFAGCKLLTDLSGIENWNVSHIISFYNVFNGCSSLTKLDLSNWSTDSATTMQSMFQSCTSLTEIKGIENFNVSKVKDFGAMFKYSSLTSLDLRNWVTSSATSFQDMFSECRNLEVIRVDNFNTSKVSGTGLNGMFSYCTKVKTLNLDSFVNPGLGNFLHFCNNCTSLEYVSAQNFVWGKCNAIQGAFTNCKSLKMLDLTNFDGATISSTSSTLRLSGFNTLTCPIYYDSNKYTQYDTHITNLSNAIDIKGRLIAIYTFDNTVSNLLPITGGYTVDTVTGNITHRVLSSENIQAISFNQQTSLKTVEYMCIPSTTTSLSSCFNGCTGLTAIDASDWNTSNVTNMSYMFNACTNLTTLDVTNWDTSKVINMGSMFYNCSKLTTLDVSKWDTSLVTNMSNMFSICSKLTTLDVSDWDISSVTSMGNMFNGCSNLQTLNVSNWKTSKVTDMNGIFYNCSKLTTLDVSKWDTSLVTNITNMFNNCINLTTLDLSNWDISSVTSTNSMFSNCVNLQTLKWTNWLKSVNLSSTNLTQESLIGLIYKLGNTTEQTLTLNDTLSTYLKNPEFIYADIKGWTITPSTATTISYVDIKASDDISKVNNSTYNTCIVEITDSNKYFRLDDVVKAYTSCDTVFLYSDDSLITLYSFMSDNYNAVAKTKIKNLCFMDNFNTSNVINMSYMIRSYPNLQTLVVSNLDTSSVITMNNMFYDCPNLQILDVSYFNTSSVTNMGNMFAGCTNLKTLDVSSWDTSSVTNMGSVFYNCPKLQNLDVSNFNTSNVTNMSYMFTNCTNLQTLDVSNFNTSLVTSMAYMFQGCTKLTTLDVANFNTSSVANMAFMFNNCSSLQTLHVSNWDTLTVANIGAMFENCTNLRTLDISKWVTSSVTNMGSAFNGCSSLQTLDLSNWVTSKVTGMSNMFLGCSSLQTLNVSNFDISKVSNVSSMFNGCSSLQNLDVSNWDTSNVTNMNYLFNNCSSLQTLDVSNWDTSSATNMNGTFYGCSNLKTLNVSNWKTSLVTGMNNMFSNCSNLKTLDVSNFDTSLVTNMGYIFNGCSNLHVLNVSDWNVSKVGEMGSVFRGCKNLTTLDISKWKTSSATNMSFMFDGCASLQTLSIDNWDTSKVTDMNNMFSGCASLQTLSIGKWNTSKVNNMNNMFSKCTKLQNLDINNWDTSSVTNITNMFNNCTNLTTLDLNNWDTSKVTNMSRMFNGCYRLQALNVSKWDTSKADNMEQAFRYCAKLTTLDLNGWDTSSVTNMSFIFDGCTRLTTLDISNFDTLNATSMNNMFNSPPILKTIGMLYSNAESINKLVQIYRPNGLIVYYYDADPSQLTPISGVTFEKYIMPTTIQLPPHIQLHNLSKPDGAIDEVDIKTGILTRRVGQVVFNGSEKWEIREYNTTNTECAIFATDINDKLHNYFYKCDKFRYTGVDVIKANNIEGIYTGGRPQNLFINISKTKASTVEEFKKWLSDNNVKVQYAIEPTTEQLILNYNNSCDYGRTLPTGMCDKYDVVNSMYTQTTTSILLDGENAWDAMEEFENTVKFTATGTTVGVENLNMLGVGGLYCDNGLFPNINDDSDMEHCRVDEAGNKFYIYVDKERLMSPDLIGWQIWLQANKFNMTYELAEHLTYAKPYEELDPTQARWEGMDCRRDGAIKYHTNNSDNITLYPTLEYVAPSINNFEVPMLEPNTDYTIYAEGINDNDTIKLGGADIQFKNGKVFTSGDNQWLRIDNNDSFYNMVITRGDTTGEHVPYFKGMASVKNPKVIVPTKNLALIKKGEYIVPNSEVNVNVKNDGKIYLMGNARSGYITWDLTTGERIDNNNDAFNNLRTLQLEPGTYTITSTLDASQATGLSDGYIIALVVYADGNKVHNHVGYYLNSNFETKVLKTTVTVENYFSCIHMQRWYIGSCDGIVASIQIEKGNTATDFVPAGGSTVSYTDLKLRSLPDGIKDTINVVTGEYVQRVGEITLKGWDDGGNGELHWVVGEASQNNGETMYFSFKGIDSLIKVQDDNLNDVFASDFFKKGDTWRSDEECMDIVSKQNKKIRIRLKKSRLATLDTHGLMEWLSNNPITIQYELAEPITTKLDSQTLLVYEDGTINLSSDTGLLPTVHYTVPSTNTFHLPSMKTGTRYTLKYPSASGSIIIGDISYRVTSDSMLFTTPLKINGDTSAIIFSDTNPENVMLLEGAYNKREVPFFTGVKSVKNPNITIIDQLSTESTTYNCETEIELRGLPNGVADKLDIIKGKLTTNVGIRPYQDGDENLPNIWTDGYETVYALSSPVVTSVAIDHPTVTVNSLIALSSDYLIPQLNYRASSSNNFPLDLLQPNTTYTLYADALTSGSYTLGGTKIGVYSQPHVITLGDMTDNLLTFNGDLGLSNVMLVKGNSLKTTLPPYFLGIRSVTDGHLLVKGMVGEVNEITFDEGVVLRDCNGVKDTIDLITGTLTKRTGEITLTGVEGWYRVDNESTTDYNVFKLTLGGLKEALVMCDTLQSVFNTKMMDCIHAHTNELCIVIANATIGGNTVNALKSWLSQHPTTVVYQLRTPIEVQLENVWTTLPPTSYDSQTKISSTVSSTSLKPMISVTVATTTLEQIVSQLEEQNAELQAQNESLEQENVATMLALTDLYETMVAPMAIMSLDSDPYAMSTMSLDDEELATNVIGYTVSPMSMIYAKLVHRGLKTIHEVPYNLQVEVIYALKGME